MPAAIHDEPVEVPRVRRRWPRVIAILGGLVSAGSIVLLSMAWIPIGTAPSGARQERIERSPQWRDAGFQNLQAVYTAPFAEVAIEQLGNGSDHQVPIDPVAYEPRVRADYATAPESGLRVTWLGHSTLLLEIDGARILIDPVWGERTSPLSFIGPERWYPPPLPLDELPNIDAILISHDHYDHLDYPTVVALRHRNIPRSASDRTSSTGESRTAESSSSTGGTNPSSATSR